MPTIVNPAISPGLILLCDLVDDPPPTGEFDGAGAFVMLAASLVGPVYFILELEKRSFKAWELHDSGPVALIEC